MTPLVQQITDVLSFVTVVGGIAAVFLFVLLVSPLRRSGWGKHISDFLGRYAIHLSFIVALASVVFSLFYSNIAGFAPCVLCWWIRIFLYPQTILFFIALLKKDWGVRRYALALSWIGFLISAYATYIQFGGEPIVPCSATGAVSCQIRYFVEYGYVTIPTMALTALGIIILLMFFQKRETGSTS